MSDDFAATSGIALGSADAHDASELALLRRSVGRHLQLAMRALSGVLTSYSALHCIAFRDSVSCRATLAALDSALHEIEELSASMRALRRGVAASCPCSRNDSDGSVPRISRMIESEACDDL